MLEQSRVDRARERLVGAFPNKNSREEVSFAFEDVADYMSGQIDLFAASGAMEGVANGALVTGFSAADSPEAKQDFLSVITSLRQMSFHLHTTAHRNGVRTFFNPQFNTIAGIQAQMLQSAGWLHEAETMVNWLWADHFEASGDKTDLLFGNPNRGAWINEHSNPYLVHKAAWFATMTTVEESLWRQHGYDPDMDSLGPYWMRAQVWNDPDPAKVRNALQAVRDMNLGTTFIKDQPEGNRVYIVDEFLLLDDYDLRSVNMRRKALGLEAVEVESYLADPLPLDVLPFAKDDVLYPAYLKMCEKLVAEPYAPETSIDVRLDPETLQVSRV